MSLSDYVRTNRNEIYNFQQQGFTWRRYINTSVMLNPDFNDLIVNNNFQEELNREIIIDAFNDNDYYKAFVLAMMWGGINATRPSVKGNNLTTNFYKSLTEGRVSISTKMERIVELVNNNQIQDAYLSMMPENENQIQGIGESYFTKLFYFISCANNDIEIKPLIYDKWTKLIHIGLLTEAQEIDLLLEYYKISDLKSKILPINKTEIVYPRNEMKTPAYIDYITRMNVIADENQLNVGKLEAYLFGNPLKGKINKSIANPRVFIKQYVCKNLVLNE